MKREIKFEGAELSKVPLIKQAYLKKESQTFLSFLITSLRTRKDEKFGSVIMDIDKSARGALTQLRDARLKFAYGEIGQDESAMIDIQKVGEAFHSSMSASSAPSGASGGIYGTILNAITGTLYMPPSQIGSPPPEIKIEEPTVKPGAELANSLRILDRDVSAQIAKIKSMVDMDDFEENHIDEDLINDVHIQLLALQSEINTLLPVVDETKFSKEQTEQYNSYAAKYKSLADNFQQLSKTSELIFSIYGIITKTANSDPRKATAQYLLKSAGIVDSFLETRIPEVRPGVRVKEWKHDLQALKERATERTNPLRERRILARKAVNTIIERLKDFIRAVEASSGKKNNDIEEKTRWNRIIESYDLFAKTFNDNLQTIRSLGALGAGRSIQHGITKKQLKDKQQDLMELPSAAMRSFKYVLPVPIPLINIKL